LIKVLLVVSLLLSTLYARENPFFPLKGEKDMPYTSNQDRTLPPLKRATISLPTQARVIQKVTIEYKSLDGSVEKKSINLQNSIDWHLPIFISQNYKIDVENPHSLKTKIKFKKLFSFKYANFFALDKTLKIITKDKIIRDFLLVNPHRIVIDFKRDANFRSYIKTNKNTIFTKINIGNHAGYYRVVIRLDGQYVFKMKKISDGYIFILK